MSDPAANDPLLRALAYGHPIWMAVGLAAAGLAARSGLRIRRARRVGVARDPTARSRHLLRAKVAVSMLAVGFAGGPLSMAELRGRTPFGTAHAWIGSLAIGLLLATAWLGRRLERGRSGARDAHALLAALALLFASVAVVAGLVLLP